MGFKPQSFTLFKNTKEITLSGTMFPYTKWIPSDLGITWSEVPYIFTGGCGAQDKYHLTDLNPFSAHTHMCPKDPMYKCICIFDRRFIIQKDEEPSDLMWHEYGHVMTPYETDFVHDDKVKTFHKILLTEDLMADPTGHGPRWQKTMVALGKPHLNRPTVNLDDSKFNHDFYNLTLSL